MEEQQERQEIQNHDQIKKKFIREQLRPQRRKMAMRLMHKGILVLCAAILFGGISALSFYIMRIYFPWEDLDENVIAVPARATAGQPVEEKTVSDEIDSDTLAFLESFNKVSAQLARVGAYANSAVVKLDIFDTSMSQDHSDAMQHCGILFHEGAKSYFILTEYAMVQVANGNVPVTAGFYYGKTAEAKLCGFSEKLDLAVFSVDKSQFTQKEQQDIVIAELGDDSALALGSAALVVGKPNGRFYSVNTGLITNNTIPVSIQDQELQMYTMNLAYQENRIGFVLNIQGQLVGMLTAKHTMETGEMDTAFVGLSDLAADLNGMIRGKEIPYLGIYGIGGGSGAAQRPQGIYVQQVEPRSPAYQGKLRVADRITEVDGHAMQKMEDLHAYLAECQSGQEITVTIYRQGDSQSMKKRLKITVK
ncbi:MAG: S1C family serine protease [Lachnospiraceae bacterium]|nr:S1C family serine protease [Lachnospiraceae bacterium]